MSKDNFNLCSFSEQLLYERLNSLSTMKLCNPPPSVHWQLTARVQDALSQRLGSSPAAHHLPDFV